MPNKHQGNDMKKVDYLIFVASINENMKLAHTISGELKSLGKSSEIIDIISLQLPMYSSKAEAEDGIPECIDAHVKLMQDAQAYIVVAPEYNYSIPPSLTNFVAWVSRVGDDFRGLFNEKTILIATFSGGGGDDVLNAMRTQFTKLGSLVIPRQILVNYKQILKTESLKKTLIQLIKFAS